MNQDKIDFMVTLAEALLFTLHGAHIKPVDKGLIAGILNKDEEGRFITIVVPPPKHGERTYCYFEEHGVRGLGILGFRAYREDPEQITKIFAQRLREWEQHKGEKPALTFSVILPEELDLDLVE